MIIINAEKKELVRGGGPHFEIPEGVARRKEVVLHFTHHGGRVRLLGAHEQTMS